MTDRQARIMLIERGHWHSDAREIVEFLKSRCLSQAQFENAIRGLCK